MTTYTQKAAIGPCGCLIVWMSFIASIVGGAIVLPGNLLAKLARFAV